MTSADGTSFVRGTKTGKLFSEEGTPSTGLSHEQLEALDYLEFNTPESTCLVSSQTSKVTAVIGGSSDPDFAANWDCVNPSNVGDPDPKCTLRLATATEGYEFMPGVYEVTFPIRSVRLTDCKNYYEDLSQADWPKFTIQVEVLAPCKWERQTTHLQQ